MSHLNQDAFDKMDYTEQQPNDGDTILHCAHALESEVGHWFKIGEIEFQRPDGSHGKSKWVLLCEQCYAVYELSEKTEGDMLQLIAGDSQLVGGEPTIKKNPERLEEKVEE